MVETNVPYITIQAMATQFGNIVVLSMLKWIQDLRAKGGILRSQNNYYWHFSLADAVYTVNTALLLRNLTLTPLTN